MTPTSISVSEKDLNQTRGAIAYHFKSKLGLFEETVNKYYLNRVMFSSVPEEEYRGRLKRFLCQICFDAGGRMFWK